MTSGLEQSLTSLIEAIPLELFAFIASFIEEVIAPIPSAGVLVLTGSFAAVQGRTVLELIPLVVIAAAGKALGAIIVYFFADKISHFVFRSFGKWFKVSSEEVSELGKRITGTPRDYLILTACRALPIIPSSAMSVGCGVLKIPFRLFMITTVIGTIVRDSVFIYAGYTGADFLKRLTEHSVSIESYVQLGIVSAVILVFIYIYVRRSRKAKDEHPSI
ncbi:VTT domain-containing protein [Patescibacteria group bacterium]|nr:VTT domain-containing protein [Patescibacteria group bacterium]